MSNMTAMQPLPLAPAGSIHVASGVDFLEDAEGSGSVFLWGMAAWCWRGGDAAARRLAAVQLVNSKAARQRQVAEAFGVHENSLVRWRSAYAAGGAAALVTDRPGPRGPSKLTEEKRAEIAELRASGLSLAAVARRSGVSTDTVRRVTVVPAGGSLPDASPEEAVHLVPLASPMERAGERALARFGMISDAPPVICEGASLPLVGTLLILPALAATGLLEIAARVYGNRAAAFYSLRSLLCSIVFACLLGEPRATAQAVRALVGADARPTICFDRGGWSPKLFKELTLARFDILTYRKKPAPSEPRRAFGSYTYTDAHGHEHHYLLADRRVAISYQGGRRRFTCRQITRLDPATGHQTQVLTTRTDEDPALIAHLMFSRWSQENFFRYMRAHYALDALDSYSTEDDDPARSVPNPARKEADRALAAARRSLAVAEANQGRAALAGRRTETEIAQAFSDAHDEIERLAQAAKAIPARVPLGLIRPQAVRMTPERKRIHDAIRMATYNAESALARLLAPHYARAEDEARSLLREAFGAPGDLEVVGGELHVRIDPLSAPRRTAAIAGLCQDLTATKTCYPGTQLTLAYSVKSGS